jgi:hypothetical protein
VKRAGAATAKAESSYSAPPLVRDVLQTPGRPLDDAARAYMEPRFGHDFSKVRIHADGRAAESARSVNALAYTVGDRIVFGAGQYSPSTAAGRGLIAHELTHVVQQQASGPALQRQAAGEPQESKQKKPKVNPIIPVDKFIEYVEAVERAYPGDTPSDVVTRVRQHYYTGLLFDVLIPLAHTHDVHVRRGPDDFGNQLRSERRLIDERIGRDAYEHLTAHADENKPGEGDNPSPYVQLADGQQVDVGHLLLGMDALGQPATGPPYSTYGVPNIDPATWAADLGIASVWMTTHEDSGKPHEDAPVKLAQPDLDAYYKMSAPEQDLLGDVDAFGAHAQRQAVPGAKLSHSLRAYYLGGKGQAAGVEKRWLNFCVMNGLMPKVSGKSVTWPPEVLKMVYDRVSRFSDLYGAGKAGAFLGVLTTMLQPGSPGPPRGFWPHTLTVVQRFLEYVRVNLEKEAASD